MMQQPTISQSNDGSTGVTVGVAIHDVVGEVDFGWASGQEGDIARTSFLVPAVSANTQFLCGVKPVATADHDSDDCIVEGLHGYANNLIPGVGFDVVIIAPQNTWGRYAIFARWLA